MKPKVAIIAPAMLPIPPTKGGAVEELVNLLILQNEIEHKIDLTIISVYEETAYNEALKFTHTKFKWIKYSGILAKLCNRFLRHIYLPLKKEPFYNYLQYQIIKFLKKEKFDKVILESNADFVNILGSKIGRDRLYCHMHILPDMKPGTFSGCKCVIAVSEFIRKQIVSQSNKSASDVVVLKNSINEDKFKNIHSHRAEMRSRLGLNDNCIAICFVGRIVPQKGVKHLLDAFLKLKTTNAHLYIIGSLGGNFKDSDKKTPFVEELFETATDSNNVTFTGYVDNNDLPKLLSAMDIAVMPSFYKEAAAINNIEYQAMGLPIITTNSGGIPEFVSSSAIILEPDDTLVDKLTEQLNILIKDKDERLKHKKASLENAKKYTKAAYYNQFLSLLK